MAQVQLGTVIGMRSGIIWGIFNGAHWLKRVKSGLIQPRNILYIPNIYLHKQNINQCELYFV
jgi:hypothetical protein